MSSTKILLKQCWMRISINNLNVIYSDTARKVLQVPLAGATSVVFVWYVRVNDPLDCPIGLLKALVIQQSV